MKKRIEQGTQPELRLQEFHFGRVQRRWLASAVLASQTLPSPRVSATADSVPGWNSTTSWIRRQRLN